MFTLKKDETYKWPVKVSAPKDGGGFIKMTFTGIFKSMGSEEMDAAVDGVGAGNRDDAILDQVFIGFEDIKDEDGNMLESNEDSIKALLNVNYVKLPILEAWMESQSGGAYKRKN